MPGKSKMIRERGRRSTVDDACFRGEAGNYGGIFSVCGSRDAGRLIVLYSGMGTLVRVGDDPLGGGHVPVSPLRDRLAAGSQMDTSADPVVLAPQDRHTQASRTPPATRLR